MIKKILVLLVCLSFNAFAIPVDINTATAKELATNLKGIGIKKAQAIIEYRKTNGKFSNVSELANIKGIGKKTVATNKANFKALKAVKKKKSTKKKQAAKNK